MRRGLFLALLAAGVAHAQQTPQKSDWETQYEEKLREQRLQEEGIKMLPAFPRQENLIEFFVSAASDWRFFVDAASVNVEDGVVRYTVVARHPDGGENVAYEALWCAKRQYRSYASGRRDGTWSPRLTPWRDYPRLSPTSWQHALGKEYFCPYVWSAVGSTKEALDALRNGGHPAVKGR